ncbi:Early nodulin-12A [Frankliniella fusca]|uniref:Early nodulin-12A n=1 Tax=Frankliniella fusca TaxID=407009 RepID=A0AAE1H5C1_9NEOP|nr:Early nodulin-12A [Frankliniella fusca]
MKLVTPSLPRSRSRPRSGSSSLSLLPSGEANVEKASTRLALSLRCEPLRLAAEDMGDPRPGPNAWCWLSRSTDLLRLRREERCVRRRLPGDILTLRGLALVCTTVYGISRSWASDMPSVSMRSKSRCCLSSSGTGRRFPSDGDRERDRCLRLWQRSEHLDTSLSLSEPFLLRCRLCLHAERQRGQGRESVELWLSTLEERRCAPLLPPRVAPRCRPWPWPPWPCPCATMRPVLAAERRLRGLDALLYSPRACGSVQGALRVLSGGDGWRLRQGYDHYSEHEVTALEVDLSDPRPINRMQINAIHVEPLNTVQNHRRGIWNAGPGRNNSSVRGRMRLATSPGVPPGPAPEPGESWKPDPGPGELGLGPGAQPEWGGAARVQHAFLKTITNGMDQWPEVYTGHAPGAHNTYIPKGAHILYTLSACAVMWEWYGQRPHRSAAHLLPLPLRFFMDEWHKRRRRRDDERAGARLRLLDRITRNVIFVDAHLFLLALSSFWESAGHCRRVSLRGPPIGAPETERPPPATPLAIGRQLPAGPPAQPGPARHAPPRPATPRHAPPRGCVGAAVQCGQCVERDIAELS